MYVIYFIIISMLIIDNNHILHNNILLVNIAVIFTWEIQLYS